MGNHSSAMIFNFRCLHRRCTRTPPPHPQFDNKQLFSHFVREHPRLLYVPCSIYMHSRWCRVLTRVRLWCALQRCSTMMQAHATLGSDHVTTVRVTRTASTLGQSRHRLSRCRHHIAAVEVEGAVRPQTRFHRWRCCRTATIISQRDRGRRRLMQFWTAFPTRDKCHGPWQGSPRAVTRRSLC